MKKRWIGLISSFVFCACSAQPSANNPSRCVEKSFLGIKWTECDTDAMKAAFTFNNLPKKEIQELDSTGLYKGCGATSAASLLYSYKLRGMDTLDDDFINNPDDINDKAFTRAVDRLVIYMKSSDTVPILGQVSGRQRATMPNNYIDGLQRYLDERQVPLIVRYSWGWGPQSWRQTLEILKQRVQTNDPVIVFEVSPEHQHYGIAQSFEKVAFGDLFATLYTSLSRTQATNLNLSQLTSVQAGVIWLEPK